MAFVTYTIIVILLLALGILVGWWLRENTQDPLVALDGITGKIDPWALQRELMRISDQELPNTIEINKTVLMYSALQAEELAETYQALYAPLSKHVNAFGSSASEKERAAIKIILGALARMQSTLALEAVRVRRALEPIVERSLCIPLMEADMVPIFDGAVDLAVVNCGFALACGLDGALGYADVVGSNLSKRNPRTGMIDKDPSGKWIKGPLYQGPDLLGVMRQTESNRIAEGNEKARRHAAALTPVA